MLWTIGLAALVLFSFITANAALVPKVTLKVTRLDFANGYWNYRAGYTLKNLYDGSLKVNGAMFVNNINQSGSSETGYTLKPDKKYTFTLYSKSGGKGRILASKVVVASKAPTVIQTTHRSITTPTPVSVPITKKEFLLSGSLCNFDYSLLPQSENNARRLIDLCESIVPKLEAKFGRGPSAPPYKIQFYVSAPGSQGTGGDANASAGSTGIYLSTNYWQGELPDEAGYIMAHELTHVITSHFGSAWLAEAIADYGAYIVAGYAGYSKGLFESNCYHFPNDIQNQNHVYGCTYKFLKFVEDKYDSTIVFKLNKALQSENYSENVFAQYTGKTYNQLISECSQDSICGGVYHGGL